MMSIESVKIESREPMIYDVGLDEMRPVTQADIDGMVRSQMIMARFRDGVRMLEGMCKDACLRLMPEQQFYDIVRELGSTYTSGRLMQEDHDRMAGQRARLDHARRSNRSNEPWQGS